MNETCYKIYGYPEWWPDKNKPRKFANVVNEFGGFDDDVILGTPKGNSNVAIGSQPQMQNMQAMMKSMIQSTMQQEFSKLLKGKQKESGPSDSKEYMNFAHFGDISGPQD